MTNRASVSEPTGLSSVVTVSAPAKINLILRILDRRPDGYHNVWSIMQTVALVDEVRLRLSHTGQVRLRCDSSELSGDHNNLVHKAAVAVLERAGTAVGLDIELKKMIPLGAGLGGGSSDAAATIVGLNRLLRLEWSQMEMRNIAQTLGSDVPFFLFAPSAVVAGRGEAVKPVAVQNARWAVLVNPGFGVETRWAYHELATSRQGVRPLSDRQRRLDEQTQVDWPQLKAAAENDFESPVFAKHPALGAIKQTLLSRGAEIALLSGSGATVFGLYGDEQSARRAQTEFLSDSRLKTFVVPTCSGPLIAS
ncbi:4-diphosphocytidyl-2-C-methyl-D-erythritol kinase [Nitrospira japonica]|uniref:4-diphosphocytidyl-2-C-methyl-D-erythritol kinase n=1 Tax=Nitrospira japonica TaxID=1325564 RepID=A0A1W1I4I8_9BACT|nr:4-(cytidine 5'-diphospho)-2-C-methyl-D-erythritol kinase [Nitrospira japonica]SLM47924.1 4-diphosphocytidyl-2-C-methyl-D-erythritol kinase [Nitrospira japonica]